MADFFSINMARQLPLALVFLLGVLLINAGLKRLSSLNNIHPFILFLIYWIMLSVGAYSGIGPTDDLDWINLVGILSPVVGFVFFVISYLLSLFLNRKTKTEDYDNWRHIGATYDQYNAWESTPDNSFYSNVSSEAPQIRPWVRYFAKLFDLYVSSIATGLILGICFPQILNLSDLVLNIIAFLIFPFYEAFFLSLFGTTPGKWLLSTSVSNKQQQPLSFLDALTRGYKVVIKGLGLGIPIVILVTGFYQYKMLKENGINSWDAEKSHVVLHDHLNPLKVIIFVVLFIFIIWLMSFSM